MDTPPPSQSTSWDALEGLSPEIESLPLDVAEMFDLNDIFFAPTTPAFAAEYAQVQQVTLPSGSSSSSSTSASGGSGIGGGGSEQGTGHLVCKWCRTKRFHRTQALRNHENKCERDKMKELQQQQQRLQSAQPQLATQSQQRPLRVRPLAAHPQHHQLHAVQPSPQQSWSDQAMLWQNQQHIPVAAAAVSAAAFASTGVFSPPPPPFSSISSQQSSSCPQLSHLSPPLQAKQQQLVQLRQPTGSLSSSPYSTPASSPPQGLDQPFVTVNLSPDGNLISLTMLRPLSGPLTVTYAGLVRGTQAEVTRPDHYSIWLSPFDILQAARGRTAFLDIHGDTGALYRLGFFSPQGHTSGEFSSAHSSPTSRSDDRPEARDGDDGNRRGPSPKRPRPEFHGSQSGSSPTMSCPGAYNGCTFTSASVPDVWTHMESCTTYLRERVLQWHRAMRDLFHFAVQLKQGHYAPEPEREYDPGDYLPPLYNAIKRSIQELYEMGAEGPVGDVAESDWQVRQPQPLPLPPQQQQDEDAEALARAAEESAPRSQPSPKEKGKAKKGKTKTKTKRDHDHDHDEDEDSSSTEGGRYNEWPRPWQRPVPGSNLKGGEGGAPQPRAAEEQQEDAHDDDPYRAFGLFEEYTPTPFKQRQQSAKGKERDEGKGKSKSRVKKVSKSSQDLKSELKKQVGVSTDSFFSDPSIKASLDAGHFKAKPHRLPPASADLKSQLAPLLLPDTIPEKVLNARLHSWAAYPVGLLRQRCQPAWELNAGDLEIGGPIALGRFGQERKAMWKQQAVAVIPVAAQDDTSPARQKVFAAEMEALIALHDPHLVTVHGGLIRPCMSVVVDHTPLGSLHELLHNHDLVPDIPPPLKIRMARQAALGMHFLHSRGLAHGDLRSGNLLLDAAGSVKVGRFGFAGLRQDTDAHLTGSVHHLAPEVMAANEDGKGSYVEALADVYAFGVVLWELLTRQRPYEGLSPAAIALLVTRDSARPDTAIGATAEEATLSPSPAAPTYEPVYQMLLDDCWHRDPLVRPTFDEVRERLEAMPDATVASTAPPSSSPVARTGTSTASSTSSSSVGSPSTVAWLEATASQGRTRPPPEGKIAFVFTDIANGVRLWSACPAAAMREATLCHNQILRSGLARRAGYELGCFSRVKAGEGAFYVAFPSIRAALSWCSHVQSELAGVDWAAFEATAGEGAHSDGDGSGLLGREGLRVRMGVHVGWPTLVSEESLSGRRGYGGPVVEIAAKLRTRAAGGQILLSGDAHRDIPFSAFGRHKERSFVQLGALDDAAHRQVELYEMQVEGLPTYTASVAAADENAATVAWQLDFADIETEADPVGAASASSSSPTTAGAGSFGLVFRGKWKGGDVGVRRLANQRVDERGLLDLRTEAAALSRVRHQNLVQLLGACMRVPNLCLVTEWAAHGSLEDLLAARQPLVAVDLPWRLRLRIVRDIARGLQYLHSLTPPLVHGRLTSANVLLDGDNTAKLADFGFDRTREANALLAPAPTMLRPPAWTAPEVLRELGCDSAPSVDVYALGVIMWEVATRRRPYEGRTYLRVIRDVLEDKRPEIPTAIGLQGAEGCGGVKDQAYLAMMARCWHRRASRRPTLEEVLRFLDGAIN